MKHVESIYKDSLCRIETLAARLYDILDVGCAENIPYLFKLAEALYSVVRSTMDMTHTETMSFEEKEAYLTEMLPEGARNEARRA